MTNTVNVQVNPLIPDGTMITQIENQTFIVELFFNHDSNETFQDKLLKVMLTDMQMTALRAPCEPMT